MCVLACVNIVSEFFCLTRCLYIVCVSRVCVFAVTSPYWHRGVGNKKPKLSLRNPRDVMLLGALFARCSTSNQRVTLKLGV